MPDWAVWLMLIVGVSAFMAILSRAFERPHTEERLPLRECPFPRDLEPEHGPGAVAGRVRQEARRA